MLVDTAQEAALRVSAAATVLWVGTRRRRLVRVQRRLTALHVTLVGMALAAARQASALVTVLLVGTPPQQLQQDRLQLTALRSASVLSLTLWEARATRAALHVALGVTWT